LQRIRDNGDWERWLAFFLRGISEVSAQAAETARRILKQREDDRNRIVDALGRAAGSGHRVLEHLYEKPIVSVNYIRDLLNVTYPAANQLVDRLVSIGILEEITGQSRNRQFRYATYIDLFVDGGKPGHG
jgi:Fic family protein